MNYNQNLVQKKKLNEKQYELVKGTESLVERSYYLAKILVGSTEDQINGESHLRHVEGTWRDLHDESEELQAAALLHGAVKGVARKELLDLGIPEKSIELIDIASMSAEDVVETDNVDAIKLKIASIRNGSREANNENLKKLENALTILSKNIVGDGPGRLSRKQYIALKGMDNLIERSYYLASALFEERKNKYTGEPYIRHLEGTWKNVANEGEELQIAALLHDTIEDIDGVGEDDLLDLDIPQKSVELVKIVSRDKEGNPEHKTYGGFIDGIIRTGNVDAIKLKIADMKNNMDQKRLDMLRDVGAGNKADSFEVKYQDVLKKLESALARLLGRNGEINGGTER